jgi:hypothetical protein
MRSAAHGQIILPVWSSISKHRGRRLLVRHDGELRRGAFRSWCASRHRSTDQRRLHRIRATRPLTSTSPIAAASIFDIGISGSSADADSDESRWRTRRLRPRTMSRVGEEERDQGEADEHRRHADERDDEKDDRLPHHGLDRAAPCLCPRCSSGSAAGTVRGLLLSRTLVAPAKHFEVLWRVRPNEAEVLRGDTTGRSHAGRSRPGGRACRRADADGSPVREVGDRTMVPNG